MVIYCGNQDPVGSVVPGPKTERCFDYDEIKSRGPVGREIISGCSLCPCKKK